MAANQRQSTWDLMLPLDRIATPRSSVPRARAPSAGQARSVRHVCSAVRVSRLETWMLRAIRLRVSRNSGSSHAGDSNSSIHFVASAPYGEQGSAGCFPAPAIALLSVSHAGGLEDHTA